MKHLLNKDQQNLIDILEDSEMTFEYEIPDFGDERIVIYINMSIGDNRNIPLTRTIYRSSLIRTEMKNIISYLNADDPIMKRIQSITKYHLDNINIIGYVTRSDGYVDFTMVFLPRPTLVGKLIDKISS